MYTSAMLVMQYTNDNTYLQQMNIDNTTDTRCEYLLSGKSFQGRGVKCESHWVTAPPPYNHPNILLSFSTNIAVFVINIA